MFIEFTQNLYKRLIEAEFENLNRFNSSLTEETEFINLFKQIGPVMYIVNLINYNKTNFIKDYKTELINKLDELNVEHIIIINLLIYSSEKPLLNDDLETQNERVHLISWLVDLTQNELIVPSGQPDKILNLHELINLSLNDKETDLTNISLTKLENEVKINTKLKAKTTDIYFTFTLIIINTVIWLILYFESQTTDIMTLLIEFGANSSELVFKNHQYYRLFTSMFLHIDFFHLLGNCFSLYLFGSKIEKYYGKACFLIIYIVSGLAGSFMSVVFNTNISVGASGAIYGLIGAVLALTSERNKKIEGLSMYVVAILIVTGLAFGFLVPQIDNFAHIGGLLLGYICGFILCPLPENSKNNEV